MPRRRFIFVSPSSHFESGDFEIGTRSWDETRQLLESPCVAVRVVHGRTAFGVASLAVF